MEDFADSSSAGRWNTVHSVSLVLRNQWVMQLRIAEDVKLNRQTPIAALRRHGLTPDQ